MTQDIYVGSSINLGGRFKDYFNISHISNPKRSNSIIHRALLKYGYSNFQLEILEFCDPNLCLEREQHYINLLKPRYNILKKAGSSLGFKHSEETRAKMSSTKTGEKHPMFGKPRPEGAGSPAQKILVFDINTKVTTHFDSIKAAGETLNIK